MLDTENLFDLEPDWGRNPQSEIMSPAETMRFYGLMYRERHQTYNDVRFTYTYFLTTKAKIQKLIDFFDGVRGRYGNFWFPTWTRDIVVTRPISSADVQLTIQDIGYQDFVAEESQMGRFLFFLPQGSSTPYLRKVDMDNTDGTTLTLESAIGFDCSASRLSNLLVCFLLYGRFDVDELSLKYVTNEAAYATLTTIETANNYPEDLPT